MNANRRSNSGISKGGATSSSSSSSSGLGPIRANSDEPTPRVGTTKVMAQKASTVGGSRLTGRAEGGAKVADGSEKHQATVKPAAAVAAAAAAAAGSAQAPASKLVFGLNPRAHRVQVTRPKPESGSVRSREVQANAAASSDRAPPAASNQQLSNRRGSSLAEARPGVSESSARASSQAVESADGSTSTIRATATRTKTTTNANTTINTAISTNNNTTATARKSGSQIRASKYGNFYKPQDLTSTSATATARGQQASSGSSAGTTMTKTTATSGKEKAPSETPQATTPAGSARATTRSVRSSSRSPDRSRQMARRKSFDEDISTMKTESAPLLEQQQQQQQQTQQQLQLQQQQQPSQQAVFKPRTQFNVLPPPQLSIATTGKGSVVGYAKSRIYDRPVKQILANPPEGTYSALDDRSGQIPASILSGFKPPKQVNVSKAREKWEGGEPFAKCKSRKRLAAQANRKLLPGTWSMTSVVATQQLHLQQALAQSASSANHRSNPLETDPSVKVLTRGSVLERVQQFEKAPAAQIGSGATELPLIHSGSLDSLLNLASRTPSSSSSSNPSRSSSSSSSSSLGSDGGDSGGGAETIVQRTSSEPSAASKQAQYKSRVSSIQQQQQQQLQQRSGVVPTTNDESSPLTETPLARSSSTSSTQQRRQSLRRRSSIGLRRSSTESLIPRFYHPNGKPNTYEIEIRKRDIVACFDKLPERRALVAVDNATSRRHFNQVALACGYSEYFKLPLLRFVAHQLETDPKLAQMGCLASAAHLRQRKSSTVALSMNGTSTPAVRPLVKAASVDSSTSSTVASAAAAAAASKTVDGDKKDIAAVSSCTCEQFLTCWRDLISRAYDDAAQFIHLLTLGQRQFLTPDDFVPLVQSIIDDHPGLKFLRAAPDFHMRYIQTVIARIYFNVNRSWTGKISLQELRKSNLLAVLTVLGQEEHINQITDYFSYEHFYVIYCKFWNLDQDHDLFISKEDLARHNDAAISSRIIERIFSGIVSKQIQQTGRMSYSDFVWFLIAEEDKKHPRSIEYWFRLMDLDGDGYISMYEMEYFYYEQTKRLELMNIEALPFLDSACQILDLVNPRQKNKISLADLKRTKMATIFFDTFINLEKYLEHESREFVSTRDLVQDGVVISDWDRYASEEYESLVTEESTV